MKLTRTLFAVCVAGALGACAGASQNQHSTTLSQSHCSGLSAEDQDVSALYADARRVEPLYMEEDRAAPPTRASVRNPSRYLAGAQMYIPAQRESSAYLERVLSCHAAKTAAATDHPNDPLRVSGVRDVDVHEVGAELRIAITGGDAEAGRAILQRAEALRNQPTRVEVKQLSAAPTRAAM